MTATVGGQPTHRDPGGRGPVSSGRFDGAGASPADLRRLDQVALKLWLLTRVTTYLLVGAAAWLFASGDSVREPVPYLDRWLQWDVHHFQTIAEFGYGGDPAVGQLVPLEAFFPGLPLLLRALHFIGFDLTVAGLLVSFIAGGVVVVALARLGSLDGGPAVGGRAVLLFLLAPSAVFLAAGYTEALFLAFALPAWLAARRGHWLTAGLLAAGAASVRVTGVFLAAALVIEFLTARDGRRRWLQMPWLLLPGIPVLAYMAFLNERTGDWFYWRSAQEQGWYRSSTGPWETFRTTWDAAAGGGQTVGFAWMFGAEIVAVLVGVALTGWLLWRRRWGELTYVGLQVAAFATSTWYFSVPRATLLWWPLWIGLAAWSLRRQWLLSAYLTVIAPFMVVFTLLFAVGRWAG
jgi:hypothetical protein